MHKYADLCETYVYNATFVISERCVWGVRNAWMLYRIRISSDQLDVPPLKTRTQAVSQHRTPHSNWHGAICQKHENFVWVQTRMLFDSAENNKRMNIFLNACYKV